MEIRELGDTTYNYSHNLICSVNQDTKEEINISTKAVLELVYAIYDMAGLDYKEPEKLENKLIDEGIIEE